MRKSFLLLLACFCCAFNASAQSDDPVTEHVMTLKVTLGEAYNVGKTSHGNRFVIPITGGTFEGPKIKGTIIPGGADYQLQAPEQGRTELEAIYSIRTDDGVNIHVRNRGIITGEGKDTYFYTSPVFEAPADSKYAWLNNSIYVCRPVWTEGFNGITLKVWRVRTPYNYESTIAPIQDVPEWLNTPAKEQGKIETFNYQVTREGKTWTKHARVYLPYGYKAKDKNKRYNVLYLMHGGGDNSTSFLTPPQDWQRLCDVLDHLIMQKRMDPIIVVTPTFYDDDENIGANRMEDATRLTAEYHNEMQDWLIPSVESKYNTYLQGKDLAAIEASRAHRAYGGFSMGALSTWNQLAYGVNAVKYFLPLSGDLWIFDADGKKQSLEEVAKWLNAQLEKSPYKDDFFVYAYTGTDDIAYNPEKELIKNLDAHAPLFRYAGSHSEAEKPNLRFSQRQGGRHYYGHINQYLYFALPLIFKE